MTDAVDVFEVLREPFPEQDIGWRIGRSGAKDGKPWAMCLAYITNRAIQTRLDSVVGPANWYNRFRKGPQGGVLCGLSLRVGGQVEHAQDDWITKWDGAENTEFESVKGGLSDAMKRAAVLWGVGRYLYKLDANFAECRIGQKPGDGWFKAKAKNSGSQTGDVWFWWHPPKLPEWAVPSGPNVSGVAIIDTTDPEVPSWLEPETDEAGQVGEFMSAVQHEPLATLEEWVKQLELILLEDIGCKDPQSANSVIFWASNGTVTTVDEARRDCAESMVEELVRRHSAGTDYTAMLDAATEYIAG